MSLLTVWRQRKERKNDMFMDETEIESMSLVIDSSKHSFDNQDSTSPVIDVIL